MLSTDKIAFIVIWWFDWFGVLTKTILFLLSSIIISQTIQQQQSTTSCSEIVLDNRQPCLTTDIPATQLSILVPNRQSYLTTINNALQPNNPDSQPTILLPYCQSWFPTDNPTSKPSILPYNQQPTIMRHNRQSFVSYSVILLHNNQFFLTADNPAS